jgi:hypothetical protein
LLQRFILLCLSVSFANALWAWILPNASGKLAAVAGAVLAGGVAALGAASPGMRRRLMSNPPAVLDDRKGIVAVLVPFLLPALVLRAQPVLAFWRFDGRAALLAGWLIAITVAITFEHRRAGGADRRVTKWLLALFILFGSGLWLTPVMDTGIASFMVGMDRRGPKPCQWDEITTMITIWEANPVSEHLFLAWQSQENFARRIAYSNHMPPYLFIMYVWTEGVRRVAGLPLWAAANTMILLPILVLIAGFGTLLARSGLLDDRTDLRGLLTLFLAIGILLTTWRLWIDLVRYNSDNTFPLVSAVFILVYALLLPPMRTRAAAAAAAVFAGLVPIHTPMLLLPAACLFGQGGRNWRDVLERNRSLVIVCSAALVTGLVIYAEPRLLIRWKGYHPAASPFLFRSGLDGDTSYFSNILQAALAPCPVGCCYARPISELLLPAFVPLAIFGPLAARRDQTPGLSVGRLLLFLTTPYVMSLILFPQSASIHPYLYDHLLIIPVVVTGLVAMLSPPVERRLSGAGLLLFLLLVSGILMSNFIGLAQGFTRAMAYFAH